ncbi:hypothetical protein BCEP4_1000004 [Burkholderia cepacia]|nr:hypothetical protein BCEP4_1000004 [Burkholderia cepacia]
MGRGRRRHIRRAATGAGGGRATKQAPPGACVVSVRPNARGDARFERRRAYRVEPGYHEDAKER